LGRLTRVIDSVFAHLKWLSLKIVGQESIQMLRQSFPPLRLPGSDQSQHFWNPILYQPIVFCWGLEWPGQVTAFVAPVTSARATENWWCFREGLPLYGSIIEPFGGGFLEYPISLNIVSIYL
jgi:hypothetical protein